jgi:hypothetical protein
MSDVHPWDIDDVHKGWELTPETLEAITGHRRDSKAYQFACLELETRLRKDLRDDGRAACVAFVRGNLRVLTDPEAVEYTAKKSADGVRRVLTADREMSQVDIGNLSEPELERLTTNRIKSGARAAALRGARTAIKRIVRSKQPKPLAM